MADETKNAGTNVADPNKAPDVKNFLSDPVVWVKKNHKISHGNVCDLRPDTVLNVRFREGSEYLGIKFTKDTLDIPGMKQQIVDGDGIHEPIWVSRRAVKNAEGKIELIDVPIRGNRRTFAGQELASDPATPEALRKQLTTMTPMIILTGLTAEQEQALVNDQTQKRFLKSELVRQIIGVRKQGWNFEKISMLLWEQLGEFSRDGKKKLAEIRELNDPTLKREKVKTWLRGTLDNYLLWGIDLGPWMQKQILLSEMRLDGILPATEEQPYFYTDVNSQKRIAALKKAKEADGEKYSPLMLVEGTEFKKVADEFHNLDYGNKTATETTPVKKMADKKTIEELLKTATSATFRSVLTRVLGNESLDYTSRDEVAAIHETKQMLLDQFFPRLKPEMKAIVRAIYINPDPMDFQKFLEANCEPETGTVAIGKVAEPAGPHPDSKANETFSLTDNANAG